MIVLDSSQSMDEVFQEQKKLLLELAKTMPISAEATRVCLIQYSKTPILVYPFTATQNNSAFYKVVSGLSDLGGETNTAEAIKFGLRELKNSGRSRVEEVFVLISDGNSFNSWKTVLSTAKELHESGAKILILGLGRHIYMPELKVYTGKTGHLFSKESAAKFEGLMRDLVGEICGGTSGTIPIVIEPPTKPAPAVRLTTVAGKATQPPPKVTPGTMRPQHTTAKVSTTRKSEVLTPRKPEAARGAQADNSKTRGCDHVTHPYSTSWLAYDLNNGASR
ncbi:unnamed protein product [Soboliphyme baturini]|uniref:VWFA domain-containing protein n=1 Tax=Soboliphyme baturini TaxID=241478 RepID=A0A183JB24_9BILA|nr:unnamed protein product [Soboliphyme baturini]